jgi:hypothetical protein
MISASLVASHSFTPASSLNAPSSWASSDWATMMAHSFPSGIPASARCAPLSSLADGRFIPEPVSNLKL